MATCTITVVSGAATTSSVLTFNSTDAARILADFKIFVRNPSATQQDLTDFLSSFLKDYLKQMVQVAETVRPADPTFT